MPHLVHTLTAHPRGGRLQNSNRAGGGILATDSITQLLHAWRDGSDEALEGLTPLVYDQLGHNSKPPAWYLQANWAPGIRKSGKSTRIWRKLIHS
jgi:hypothetical protein